MKDGELLIVILVINITYMVIYLLTGTNLIVAELVCGVHSFRIFSLGSDCFVFIDFRITIPIQKLLLPEPERMMGKL